MLKSIKVLHWSVEKSDSSVNATKNLPRLVQKKVKVSTNTPFNMCVYRCAFYLKKLFNLGWRKHKRLCSKAIRSNKYNINKRARCNYK